MKTDYIAFEHNGMEIYNPYADDSGHMSPVDPAQFYGFETIDTGGGCVALYKRLPNGNHILITDSGGGDVPSPNENPNDILIGLYSNDGETIACYTLAENIKYAESQQ
jgi:hypothetical protein